MYREISFSCAAGRAELEHMEIIHIYIHKAALRGRLYAARCGRSRKQKEQNAMKMEGRGRLRYSSMGDSKMPRAK